MGIDRQRRNDYDVVVAHSTVSDYLSDKLASLAGKRVYIVGGEYTQAANTELPSTGSFTFGPEMGGVKVTGANVLITNGTCETSKATGNVTASDTVVFGAAADLSDVEANPSLYRLCHRGSTHVIASCVDSTHTITLAAGSEIYKGVGGATELMFVVKGYSEGVEVKGNLTINTAGKKFFIGGAIDCDFGGLVVDAPLVQMEYMCNCSRPVITVSNNDYSTDLPYQILSSEYCFDCYGGMMNLINNTGDNAGDYIGVRISACEGGMYPVNAMGNTNSGAGAFVGVDGSNSKNLAVVGASMVNDTQTANVANINVAGLQVS